MGRLKKQRGGMLSRLLMLILLLAVIGGGVAGFAVYQLKQQVEAEGPLAEASILWVERGNGLDTISKKLTDMGAIDDTRVFKLAARVQKMMPSLQAGEYEIPAGASMEDIIVILKEGKPLLRFVTIPEGRTTKQIIALVGQAEYLDGPVTLAPAEGDLLPETYSYQRGDTQDSVLTRMMTAHDEVLAELWPNRASDLPFETMEEAVILASIVEKETGIAEERPQVASVFVNRLRRGMRLQSDPTIIYGLTGGEPLGRGIRQSELRSDTPYNTYRIRGLPPTPIANPGRDAIAAVLNPADTEYLYFVADGTGGHVFAKTLAEHNRNVAQWRRVEQERRSGN